MDDLEKRKIYNLIQLALQAFQSNKYQINSYTPYYGENGTSGIKFSVKVNETELAFFAGFSTDKKYENQLLFGVLKKIKIGFIWIKRLYLNVSLKSINFLEWMKLNIFAPPEDIIPIVAYLI